MESKALKPLEPIFQAVREGQDASLVRSAIMELGYEPREGVYPVLVDKLNDPNPGIQHAAVISLGRLGRPEAIEELIKPKIFRSTAANIRQAAVAAVGKLGDYRVIDYLLKAVEDPEWIVRTQAVTELMGKVQEILDHRDVRLIHILIHMLSLENEEIVGLAVEGFKEFGADSLPALHDALNNSSPLIRSNVARALGKLKSHQSVPYLLALLQDSEWQVRASAVEALGMIGSKASIEALVQEIQDNVGKVQEKAAEATIRFGKLATMPLLNALSRERDKFALRAIILALGKIGDPKSVPSLVGHLRSSYFIVRQAAMTALVRFGPTVAGVLLPTLSFNSSNIEPLLRDAADRRRPELQIRAIKAIGGLEDHRAVRLLKEIVDEGLPDVQEAATQALALIGCAAWGRCCAIKILAEVADSSLAPLITPSLKDDSDNARFEAVRALGKMDGPEAVKLLIGVVKKDRADFIRAEAIRALRTIGAGQAGVLETALHGLKDKSREVRSLSARLLGLFHDKKSILPLLKTMADPHWSVRESAENALMNFGHDAVPLLIEALGSPTWTTRFRAARILGEIGDIKAAAPLKKLLVRKGERKEVRSVASISLKKVQNKLPA
ncbi:MAG: HEAT repeat domain-containing protein [Candidatus Aminicenantes bacterium]|nr:HEAT repeat domain-containing protein [Candidatus Aminicenantes bacterium]